MSNKHNTITDNLPPLPFPDFSETHIDGTTTDYFSTEVVHAAIFADRTTRAPAPVKSIADDDKFRALLNTVEHVAADYKADGWAERYTEIFNKFCAYIDRLLAARTTEQQSDDEAYATSGYRHFMDLDKFKAFRADCAARTVADAKPPVVGYLVRHVKVWLLNMGRPSAEEPYGEWEFKSVKHAEDEMENMRRGCGWQPGQLEFRPLVDAAPVAADQPAHDASVRNNVPGSPHNVCRRIESDLRAYIAKLQPAHELTDEQIDAIARPFAGFGGVGDYRGFARALTSAQPAHDVSVRDVMTKALGEMIEEYKGDRSSAYCQANCDEITLERLIAIRALRSQPAQKGDNNGQ